MIGWKNDYGRALFVLVCMPLLLGCITQGSQPTATTGAAAGASSADANPGLERCQETLGTLAVDDGREATWWSAFGARTNVTTIEPMIRLMVLQSNCFVITSIGNVRTDSRMSRITDIQRNSGEYRAGSNQQKGQRVAADYFLEPAIIIDDGSLGRVGGAVGGILGGSIGRGVAGVGGAIDAKSSVVTLSLFDIRSSVQISAAEGSATSTNFGAVVGAFGSKGGGTFGGLTNTPEGKATVAAFMDAYNNMVRALRSYKAQDVEGGLGTGGRLKVN